MDRSILTLLLFAGCLSALTVTGGRETGGRSEEGDRQLRRLINSEMEDPSKHRGRPQTSSGAVVLRNTSGAVVLRNTTETTSKGLTHDEQIRRIRDKKRRELDIQMGILHALRLARKPNVTGTLTETDLTKIQARYNKSQANERWKNDNDYSSKKFFALRPACPATAGGAEQTWFATMAPFRLYFRVEASDDFGLSEANVSSAILRLHRKSTPSIVEHGHKRRPHSGGRKTRRHQSSSSSSSSSSNANESILYIYEYMKPVQRNKPDVKKLVRSVTLLPDQNDWISVNVKNVVRRWYKNPNKNSGLLIEVMDQQNKSVDARQVLDGYNCSTTGHNQDVLISRSIPTGDTEEGEDDDDHTDDMMSPETDVTDDTAVTYPNLDIVIVQQQRRSSGRGGGGGGGGAGGGRGAGGKPKTAVVVQTHTSRRHEVVERSNKTTTAGI